MTISRTLDTITVKVRTLSDLEGAIKSFKNTCRPTRRGRPHYLGQRVFVLKHDKAAINVSLRVGESCLGFRGWRMTSTLTDLDDGRRTTIEEIARKWHIIQWTYV